MEFAGIQAGDFAIRNLHNAAADVAVMAKWLSDPRVLEFYEGRDCPFDEAKIREVFFAGGLGPTEVPCIMEYRGVPLGYLQFYFIEPEDRTEYGYPPDPALFGVDLFIGEPEYWDRGLGTDFMRLILAHLFQVEKADIVTVDPKVQNARTIRFNEKCGFRRVKLLPKHELHEGVWCDAWLMAVDRAAFDRATAARGA